MGTVIDAVIVIMPDGKVIGWNDEAEKIFGRPSSLACGHSLSELIIPARHRASHDNGIARLSAGEQPRVLDRRIEIAALRADGSEFPVELSITLADTYLGRVFVGFLRDITARKQAERVLERQVLEARLMFDLAQMAAEANSFEEALEKGIKTICEVSGWPVGHAFTVTSGEPLQLVSTPIWYEREPGAADALRKATDNLTWRMGMGLPGVILESGEPLWLTDAHEETNFFRKGMGFRGAFGFPLAFEGSPIAILEFFSRSPAQPDPQLLLMVRTLGEQVGRVFERRRRQDREALLVRELHHRVKNLMAVVQSVATQTFRNPASPEAALESFLGRVRALTGAHSLMLAADDEEVGLRQAVEAAIAGAGNTPDQFRITGKDVLMPGEYATSIVLAVHELCTNAMKYGALSVPEGHIEITWGRSAEGDRFIFEWREVGGPPVTAPSRKGFGTILLTRMLELQMGARVSINYAPEGLHLMSTVSI